MDKKVITISRIGIYSMVVVSMIFFTLTRIMMNKTVPTGDLIDADYISNLSEHYTFVELNKASLVAFVLVVVALVLLKMASILSQEYTTSTTVLAAAALITALATIPFCYIVKAKYSDDNWSVSGVHVRGSSYTNIHNTKTYFTESSNGEKIEIPEAIYDKVHACQEYNIWVIRHEGEIVEVRDPVEVTVTSDALRWTPYT